MNSKVTWDYAIEVWWSIFWRTAVFSLLAGMLVGAVVGVVSVVLDKPELIEVVAGPMSFVFIPAGMVAVKIVLEKEYNKFNISASSDVHTEKVLSQETV